MELIDKLCYLADTSSVSVTHMQLCVTGWSKINVDKCCAAFWQLRTLPFLWAKR